MTGVRGEGMGHEPRWWRIDLAFPDAMVAVEVDGWAWNQDVERFRADCMRSAGEATFLFLDQKTITIEGQPVQILGMPWCGASETEIRKQLLASLDAFFEFYPEL